MSIAKRLNALLGTDPRKDPFRRPASPPGRPDEAPTQRTLFDDDDTPETAPCTTS